jgi:hypothetical protein
MEGVVFGSHHEIRESSIKWMRFWIKGKEVGWKPKVKDKENKINKKRGKTRKEKGR